MLTLVWLAPHPQGAQVVSRAMEVEALVCRAHGELPPPRDYDGVMDTATVFLLALGHHRIYVADHDTRIPIGD